MFAAIAGSMVSTAVPIPGPAVFLLSAATLAELFPGIGVVTIDTASRIGVAALIVILFEGGMHIGWRRFRASLIEISTLGVVGTFGTAFLIALFARYALGFNWTTSAILGAALAPTDPAVMFSVLGRREITGRSGTVLEGESGVNDPVGISLMLGALTYATADDPSFGPVAVEFLAEMTLGLVAGIIGAVVLRRVMRSLDLPNEALYPLLTLSFAGALYGVTALAHGSGFLAVFVMGILLGDTRTPYKGDVKRFYSSLAGIAEIAAFSALGLTVNLSGLWSDGIWLEGLLLAVVLALVARPLIVGPLILATKLHWGERVFIMWGGLKGAVPILLGTLVVVEGVADADQIYLIIFIVVALSVVIQGTSLPYLAPRLGVPMRMTDPGGVFRCTVGKESRAVGRTVRELPLGQRTWVRAVVRDGRETRARSGTVIQVGDELLLLANVEDVDELFRLFTGSKLQEPDQDAPISTI
jgi:cell volume regulation protein A